jgi:aminobenzoyl-glutamate utilization protein B
MSAPDASIPDQLKTAREWVEANAARAAQLSDQIAQFGEPGLREYRSSDALCKYLQTGGFTTQQDVADMPTAFVAEWGESEPVIGLMCEYDGTPGDSQQPVPYPAPIAPHACGYPDIHNGIGVASATAALAIQAALSEHSLPGKIRVFGTPAEKICVGKPYMARAGCFEALDAVIAWHPRRYSTLEWDTGPGPYRAEVFDFEGISAYASAPWAGVSALDGLLLMNVIFQFMREHIPRRFLASVNELVTAGGQHPTSLPSHAQAWYVFRSISLEGIDYVASLLERAAQAAATATEAEYRRRLISATRPWLPNHALASHCYRNLVRAGAPKFPKEMYSFAAEILERFNMPTQDPFDEALTPPEAGITAEFLGGADDVTEFCWHAPTARIYVAYGLNAPGMPSWAGAAFAATPVAHATIQSAAKAIAFSVVDLVLNPDMLHEAQAEFKARKQGLELQPLLPEESKPPVELSFAPHYPRGWRQPSFEDES